MDNKNKIWKQIRAIIKQVGEKYDKKWQQRKRVLNSEILVTFIIKMVGSNSKQGYGINLAEFWEICTKEGVELNQEKAVSASTICEARQKLPEDIFIKINRKVITLANKEIKKVKFEGYRIFGIDGSRVNLPRELKKEGFKVYGEDKGRYYPQCIMSCMYNLQEKMVHDVEVEKHMNERLCAINHMERLMENDIVIFDRGYFSYILFYKAVKSKGEAIFRIQTNGGNNKEIKKFLKSRAKEKIIEYMPSTTVQHDLRKDGYEIEFKPLTMRVIKQEVKEKTYVFATTLLDNKTFPKEYFAQIYRGRWGIEELYKVSKGHIEIENFHSKTERGIKQEIYAHILLINLSRLLEYEAQKTMNPDNNNTGHNESKIDYIRIFNPLSQIKINFKHCILAVTRNLAIILLRSATVIENRIKKVIRAVARVRQKIRPDRKYRRVSQTPYSKWSKKVERFA